jgi:hypothetical protein
MSPQVEAAIVAGIISLIVAGVSFVTNRLSTRAENAKQERALQRKLTEKLLDLRLDLYPGAFEITDQLQGDILFGGTLTRNDYMRVREQLIEWSKSKSGLILTDNSMHAFRELRSALEVNLNSDEALATDAVIRRIWEAKNRFRVALREDLHVLYAEEES